MGLYLCSALALAGAEPAQGQALPSAPFSREELSARAEALAASSNLEAGDRTTGAELYEQAGAALEAGENHARRAAEFQRRRQALTAQLEAVRSKLSVPEAPLPLDLPAEAELSTCLERLATATDELDTARQALAEAQDEPSRRAERRGALARSLSALRQELELIDGSDEQPQSTATAAAAAAPAVQQALDDLAAAHRREVAAELAGGEAELAWYDASVELLPLDRDLAARQVSQLEKLVAALQEQANARRAADAQRQEQLARRLAAHTNPIVKAQAEQNHQLAVERQRVAELIEELHNELDRTTKRLTSLRHDYKRTATRVEEAGLSNAVGTLLRRQCSSLPNVRKYRQKRRLRQAELAELQLHRFELEDQREPLAEIDTLAADILKQHGDFPVDRSTWILRDTIRASLETRREVLDALLVDTDSLHRLLVDLDTVQGELIDQTLTSRAYIDERVLWIRSLPWISWRDGPGLAKASRELVRPASWQLVVDWLRADIDKHRSVWVLAAALVILALLFHRYLRRRLRLHGETAAGPYCESFAPTARAALLTLLLAGLGPGVLVFLSWRLTATWPGEAFVRGVAAGLQTAAIHYFLAELVLKICRPWGLAESHFGWPRADLSLLRRNLRWLAAVVVPVSFVVTLQEIVVDEPGMAPLGRLVFVVGLLALAAFAVRTLHPTRGVPRTFLNSDSGRWLQRGRWFWYSALVGAPLVLAVMALGGYYFTALKLAERMLLSMALLVGVALACGLLWRWLLLARRSLAIKQARARRAALASETKESGEAPLEVSRVDLSTINAQSQQLLRALMAVATVFGLWAVWVEVLPALGMLNGIALWARGTENPITLAHLLVALIFGGLTAVAYRNVPGLLEISLLQRLPLDTGTRYAITSVARYLIAVVGLVAAFEEVGIGWSKVQWLIAAMSVGLGFGLQEIFANFVSGLIILFERPVRVGDIVNVGDLTGRVTQIRMRATTLLNGDRKELVIPNKAFITDRLVNWTLSDTLIQLAISLEVSADSEPVEVERLLRSIAQAHPLVLAEPPLSVTFERIGDGTYSFVLRVCVATPDHLGGVQHDLNLAIQREFHRHRIDLGKQQRDLHVRLVDGQWVPLQEHAPAARPAA
ncbi:MAG: mechanosensitive ion channel [Pirellulales bacterium]|nr:mechanosensitive ion channel [Pirellulales bacterium]